VLPFLVGSGERGEREGHGAEERRGGDQDGRHREERAGGQGEGDLPGPRHAREFGECETHHEQVEQRRHHRQEPDREEFSQDDLAASERGDEERLHGAALLLPRHQIHGGIEGAGERHEDDEHAEHGREGVGAFLAAAGDLQLAHFHRPLHEPQPLHVAGMALDQRLAPLLGEFLQHRSRLHPRELARLVGGVEEEPGGGATVRGDPLGEPLVEEDRPREATLLERAAQLLPRLSVLPRPLRQRPQPCAQRRALLRARLEIALAQTCDEGVLRVDPVHQDLLPLRVEVALGGADHLGHPQEERRVEQERQDEGDEERAPVPQRVENLFPRDQAEGAASHRSTRVKKRSSIVSRPARAFIASTVPCSRIRPR